MTDNWITKALDLPSEKGAYVLLIELARPAPLPARFGGQTLPPGTYLYFGSAYGPGGIRARVARHMKRRKTKRWHVDYLTIHADSVQARVFPGGNECDLRAKAQAHHGLTVPIPGLGSSDCKGCPAHLLKAPQNLDLANLDKAAFLKD